MTKKHRIQNRIKGFTLIELLVVMSIMSLLMSIMLPGLNNAREIAKRTVCGSNLKQFYLAWNLYSMDNEENLCSPDTLWNDENFGMSIPREDMGGHWVADGPAMPGNHIGGTEEGLKNGVLWSYAGNPKLYKCKSDRSYSVRSYSIPITMGGEDLPGGYGQAYSNQAITGVSGKIIFMDAEVDVVTSTVDWLNGPFYLKMSGSNPSWERISSGQRVTLRHSDGSNYVFGDGHYEYHKWKDPRTIKFFEREITAGQASNDNEDLRWLFKAIKGD